MSDNKLKIDVVLADVGESGAVLSDFVTQELHNTDMAKKADLVDGKVNPTQLPEFSELSGVTDKFSQLESNLRENINTSLAESKAYADSIVSVVMSKKADLVNGRVPKEQATNFKDIPGAKAAIDGLKQSLGQKINGINDSLENNFAKLTNGKVSQTVLPNDLVYSDRLTREMNDVRRSLQNTITQVEEELTALETKTNNKFISKTEAEYFTKDIELKAAIDGLEQKSYTSYASKIVETSKADLTYVDRALGALSSAATKFYPTLALANADIANLQVNQPVQVGEAVNGGLWYKATAGASTLTRSAYDPVVQAKSYSDLNKVDKTEINYTNTGNIAESGKTVDTWGLNTSLNYLYGATYQCKIIEVVSGQRLYLYNDIQEYRELYGMGWAFFDNDPSLGAHTRIADNRVEKSEVNKYVAVTVPVGAKFLVFNTNVASTSTVWAIHNDKFSLSYDAGDQRILGVKQVKTLSSIPEKAADDINNAELFGDFYDSNSIIYKAYLNPVGELQLNGQDGWHVFRTRVDANTDYYLKLDAEPVHPLVVQLSTSETTVSSATKLTTVLEETSTTGVYKLNTGNDAKAIFVQVKLGALDISSSFSLQKKYFNVDLIGVRQRLLHKIGDYEIADLKARELINSGLSESYKTRFTNAKVFAFGDSITQGTEGGYVKYLSEAFGTSVANYGSSGARTSRVVDIVTSGSGLPRRDSATSEIVWETKDYTDLACATLMIGTNDLVGMSMGSLADIPTSNLTDHANPLDYWTLFANTYIGNIALVIEFIKSKAPKAEIHIVAPIYGYYTSLGPEATESLIPHLESVTRYYGVHLIYGTYESGLSYKLMNPAASNPYSYDGVHLNVLGNEVFGKFLAQKVLSFG